MTALSNEYNPNFMNPMLQAAQGLITRLHGVFSNENGGSTALNLTEAALLQQKYPDEPGFIPFESRIGLSSWSWTLKNATVEHIVAASALAINRLHEFSNPLYESFDEVISGTRAEYTEEAYTQLRSQGVDALKSWLQLQHNCSHEQLEKINGEHLASTLCRLAQELGIDDETAFGAKAYEIFLGPREFAPYTPQNSKTFFLSPRERRDMAMLATKILFVVAREFVSPGYGAALIEMREPSLADDIKSFFRDYEKQLVQVRDANVMPDDIFEKLTVR